MVQISVRVSLKVHPKYWPTKNVQAFRLLASKKTTCSYKTLGYSILDLLHNLHLFRRALNHMLSWCTKSYTTDPRVHFFKTFSFLATDGAKMALTANPRGDRLHSVAPAAFSACYVPKETPCKEPRRQRMIWEEFLGEEPSGLIGLCLFHF